MQLLTNNFHYTNNINCYGPFVLLQEVNNFVIVVTSKINNGIGQEFVDISINI